MSDAPAGWYPDPTPPTTAPGLRYWDGRAWTGHVAPRAQDPLVTAPTTPDGAPLAGWGWRALAYLIDCVLLAVPGILVTLPAQIEMQRRMDELTDELNASATPDFATFWEGYVEVLRDQLLWQLPVMLLGIGYFVVMLRWKGATVGKLLVGLRVRLRERDGRLPWGAIAARVAMLNVLGAVPVMLLAAGLWPLALASALVVGVLVPLNLLWPLWDPRRQALHDKLARTNVVKVR